MSAFRATFEGWKLPGKFAPPPRGPFEVEVLQNHSRKWYAQLMPTEQKFPLTATRSEAEMQAAVAAQFEKCIAP